MLDVSIIIVNWNGRELLSNCISCIRATTQQTSYEVIVVDNGSTDGSQELLRVEHPEVRLIENHENVGFARANNQAIRVSEGRYVLLLNSDAFVGPHAIDTMVGFMETHPDAGMAGCKLRYENGDLQPSCTAFPTLTSEVLLATRLDKLFPKSRFFGQYLMSFWEFDSVRRVDCIMGAFMLVRSRAIDQVGLMDDRYFMYSEEADWCFQFQRNGWKVYFVPDVETVHLWWGSGRKVRIEMHIEMHRSKVLFFRKNYGTASALALKVLLALNCLVRLGPGVAYYARRDPEKYVANWRLLTALARF